MDEAHNLEDVVTNSLKKSFSIKELEKSFHIISVTLKKCNYNLEKFSKYSESLILNIGVIFESLNIYLNYTLGNNSSYKTVLISDDFYDNNIDNFDLHNLGLSIKSTFMNLLDELKVLPDNLYVEVNREIEFLERVIDILDKIFDKTLSKKYIRTISYNNYKGLFIEYSLLNI